MAQTQTRKTPRSTAKRASPKQAVADARLPGPTPLLEWIAAAIGLALLIGTMALVASEALQDDPTPPAVVVQNLGVERTAAGYLVKIRVTNRGGSAAGQVHVEGSLATSAPEPETAEATFDFLAHHSSREGGLYFQSDPRVGRLTLQAKGYSAP